MLDKKHFHQTLPTKRISAGCLLFDESGRLLVVNPTYKEPWEIPGGTVEACESPRQALVRELLEELGLELEPERLLAVDYAGESESRTESLHFIFLGPRLTQAMIARIRLPVAELREYRLLAPAQACDLLGRHLRRRVQESLRALASGETAYLEEGALVIDR